MNLNLSQGGEQLRQFGSLSAQQHVSMSVEGLDDLGLVERIKVNNSTKSSVLLMTRPDKRMSQFWFRAVGECCSCPQIFNRIRHLNVF